MPFGLKNAPVTFQRLMNSVLTGIQGLRCFIYLDDIIYEPNLKEYNKRLIEVFSRLRDHNLKLQPNKCEFLRIDMIYLGYIIIKDGIWSDPSKLHAVENFPAPKKIKDVQSFLGLAEYYQKFIEIFSKIAKPSTKLTKKGKKFNWTAEQQNSFQLLKRKINYRIGIKLSWLSTRIFSNDRCIRFRDRGSAIARSRRSRSPASLR